VASSLQAVAGVSVLHAEVVRETLDAALELDSPQHDLHALLTLFNELCADAGAAVTGPSTRAFLTTLGGRTKAATAARALLARRGVSRHAATAAALALAPEARVRRAERWSDAVPCAA
jgi:hypothetical protein